MGLVVLVVGVIGLGAVIGVVVFAVLSSRRRSGTGPTNPGVGGYPQNMSYPPQQPIHQPAQQPYSPPQPPSQGYPTPPGQPPLYSGPYAQRPPHQGQ